MRRPRRPRTLSGEEARLWGEIAKLITPLRGRAKPKLDEPTASAPVKAERKRAALPVAAKPVEPPRPIQKPASHRPVKLAELARAPAVPSPQPFTLTSAPKAPGLERRERMGLRRGTLTIDARIDLHGLYQADAHAALVRFLLRSRQAGHARVLVVTGKGGDTAADGAFSERGVLRRSVPHWLRGGELRTIVLGFEEAARHHGGAGALYVRLRRR
ncbi:Smr/MutS family protein [Methylobacterium brachythecii]|uniref:DNA mismatch repair protein MutS n=1 Tax=Methylobacterium brachythecii TaxID=1176177 RepID=A0A7W6AGE9_9HYPH|nr:Smr/MutS family protein [Methylobacterium brachythecii]MBB3901841.1 DNA-nicking Smr family endonuclease [Methylobacterium brachythecii]GLS43220.1 DNA mismatch repair protein MutS [Methylobacterium brachythecii]